MEETNWRALGLPEWLPVTNDKHSYLLVQQECTQQVEYPNR